MPAMSLPNEAIGWYFGATPDLPVDDMFSFFPCLPAQAGRRGFARPTINIDGRITPHLLQGKKMTGLADATAARVLWAEVARQVEQQGLKLGVCAELPRLRGSLRRPAGQ